MNQDNKPLFTMTVTQFKELTKSLIAEEVEKLRAEIQDTNTTSSNENDICRIDEVCQITGLKKSTIYSKLSKRQMPSLTRRKPLLFSKKQLQLWITAGRPKTDDSNQINTILKQYSLI